MMLLSTWLRSNWLLLGVLVLIASAFLLLRSTPSRVASLDELSGALASGQPTVVEFYSNF
jgi:hypothetical protein